MTSQRKNAGALGLDPIRAPDLIRETVRMPRLNRRMLPPATPPASDDDRIAREAAAMVEREEGFDTCAVHRLRGAYDGDSEHRIALNAIRLLRSTQSTRSSEGGNTPLMNHGDQA